MQGGGNSAPDTFRPSVDDIGGKGVLVLPGFGTVAAFLQTPLGIFVVVAAAVVLWLLIDLFSSPRKKRS